MKKTLLLFLIGLLSGIFIVGAAIVLYVPKQMIVVNESKLDFYETIEAIEKSAKENNWSIPHQYDLQGTMKKHGFEVRPVVVLSLCNPEHAYQILSGNDERVVSALMPCRVAVYENDGKTYISMLNAGLFSRLLGKKVNSIMKAASKENKMILKPVIQ